MSRPSSRNALKRQHINVLAVCEGETEMNYFKYAVKEYLSQQDRAFIKIDPQIFKYPREVVMYMARKPVSFDRIYYLRDLDTCDREGAEVRHLEAIEKDKIGWKTVYSYPAIEFWYILHDRCLSKPLATAKEARDCFIKCHQLYEKPMPRNVVEAKWFVDRIGTAIQNERNIRSDDILGYSNQIRPDARRPLVNPMSEIGSVINELLTI